VTREKGAEPVQTTREDTRGGSCGGPAKRRSPEGGRDRMYVAEEGDTTSLSVPVSLRKRSSWEDGSALANTTAQGRIYKWGGDVYEKPRLGFQTTRLMDTRIGRKGKNTGSSGRR